MITNALSIDVEDYFQVSAFEDVIPREHWDSWPLRVEQSTQRLLELFDTHGARATFFTLSWVAEKCPGLIRAIVDAGHELASHGSEHVRVHQQTIEEFRQDLARSKAILEDVGGVEVRGFRAASFSIDRRNLWAFRQIEAAGFDYSSSVYPVRHDLYGMPDASRRPFTPHGCGHLVEIPVATARLAGRNLPAGGGGYFRLLPYAVSRSLIRQINRSDRMPANMYFHPWEFDPDQPRPAGAPAKARFRHYLNQRRALGRLDRLLADFSWAPFRDVYSDAIARVRAAA